MRRTEKYINHFKHLSLLLWISVIPLEGWTTPSSQPTSSSNGQDIATERLAQNQAKIAHAYGNYFDALQGSRSPHALSSAQKSLSAAHESMNQWINERRKEEAHQIFDRIYFQDGTSISEQEYLKNPDHYENALSADGRQASPGESEHSSNEDSLSEKIAEAKGKPSTQNTESSRSTSQPGSSAGSENSGRPDWVLDGSQTPRELVFSAKSAKSTKPSPGKRNLTEPLRKPASRTRP